MDSTGEGPHVFIRGFVKCIDWIEVIVNRVIAIPYRGCENYMGTEPGMASPNRTFKYMET